VKALVVFCHPKSDSFNAGILSVITDTLTRAKADYRVRDLYAENFDPVLSGADLDAYEDTERNFSKTQSHAEDLAWCDTLIFVYPTWWYGLPAMLKGWLDRVLVPGVAFKMPEAGENIKPGLTHIRKLGVFTTCGASFWLTRWIGAPGRRTLLRGVRLLCGKQCKTVFAAHYLMDSSTPASREKHLTRVGQKMDRLIGLPAVSGVATSGGAVIAGAGPDSSA